MRIAVPIIAQTIDEARRDMDLAEKQGADIIEIRFDYISKPSSKGLQTLIKHNSTPKIYTNRHKSQSGPDPRAGFRGTEKERLDLFWAAVDSKAEYIDQEKDHGLALGITPYFQIFSHHDFEKTPSNKELQAIYESMAPDFKNYYYPDIIKIATKANIIDDSLRMINFIRKHTGPKKPGLIGLCMGPEGIPTRVLGSIYGSYLTFASLERGKASAPGQMTIGDLKKAYELLQIS